MNVLKNIKEFWFWLQRNNSVQKAIRFFDKHDMSEEDKKELRALYPTGEKEERLLGHIYYDKYDLEGKFRENMIFIIFYKTRWLRKAENAVIRYEVNEEWINPRVLSKKDRKYLRFVVDAWLHLHNMDNAEGRYQKKIRSLA